jgi:voltage-gated potassium channel Kch
MGNKVAMIVAVSPPLVLYTATIYVFEAEKYSDASNIQSFGDALWWSLVSVTTAGYGDSFPVTTEGRAVTGLLMFVGIGLFSSLTASLAAWVVGVPLGRRSCLSPHGGSEVTPHCLAVDRAGRAHRADAGNRLAAREAFIHLGGTAHVSRCDVTKPCQ